MALRNLCEVATDEDSLAGFKFRQRSVVLEWIPDFWWPPASSLAMESTWTVQSEKKEIPLHSLSASGITSSSRTGCDSNPRYAMNVHTLSRRAP